MTKTVDELLALPMGGASVAQNLRRAIDSGAVIEDADGTLRLPAATRDVTNWLTVANGPPLGCSFLLEFLFRHAYRGTAVPQGCSACYKVKVAPRTLRQLVAAWEIAKHIPCRSKWGVDLDNRYSQDIYAGYFFATGLDEARAVHKLVRNALDADEKLGPGISLAIKRGCAEYEAKLGPSERYQFAPELAALESHLKSRFRESAPTQPASTALACWIDVAFRIGDDTYLDFTGGKRLYPEQMSYDPQPPAA